MSYFSHPRMLLRAIAAGISLAVITAGTSVAHARSLEEATNALAQQIKKYLESKGQSDVFVSPSNGPSNTSTGPAIVKAIKDKLDQFESINLTNNKGWRVGSRFTRHEKDGTTIIGLIVSLFDDSGNQKLDFRGEFSLDDLVGEKVTQDGEVPDVVTDKEDVVNLNPPSSIDTVTKQVETKTPGDDPDAEIPVEQEPATEVERGEKLTEKIKNPSVHVGEKGFVASPFDGSPYRIEILVLKKDAKGQPVIAPDGKPAYEPRFMTVADGFAFTDLFEGDIYAVRIYNFSEYDAGVKLSIDGINCFEFSTVEPFRRLGMWVVPRAVNGKPGSVLVTGWHHSIDGQNAESFLVTSEEKGVAAQLGRESTAIGTITAMFFAAWRPDEPKPPIEIQQKRSGKGTDRGPLVGLRHTVVHRLFGKSLLAAISVRYNKPGDSEIAEDLPADPGPQDSVSEGGIPEESGT